jgi:hypothetical protein
VARALTVEAPAGTRAAVLVGGRSRPSRFSLSSTHRMCNVRRAAA